VYTVVFLDGRRPLYSQAVFFNLPPPEKIIEVVEKYGAEIAFNWIHRYASRVITFAFKEARRIKKLKVVLEKGTCTVEEEASLEKELEQTLGAERAEYLPSKYYLYAVQHPADAVWIDSKPYYLIERYDAREPRVAECSVAEEYPELLKVEADVAKRIAEKYSAMLNCGKKSWLAKKRWFYRFVRVDEIEAVPAHDVGIMLDSKWNRIDIQLDKSPLGAEEIYRAVDEEAREHGGFWTVSSLAGVHVVVPSEVARAVATELCAKRIYPDTTSVFPEKYFRMPLSLHWSALKPALMFDEPPRYRDIVEFYLKFDIRVHEPFLIELLESCRSLEDLLCASRLLFEHLLK